MKRMRKSGKGGEGEKGEKGGPPKNREWGAGAGGGWWGGMRLGPC